MKTVLRTILYPFALCEIDMHLYVHNDMFQIAINLNLNLFIECWITNNQDQMNFD